MASVDTPVVSGGIAEHEIQRSIDRRIFVEPIDTDEVLLGVAAIIEICQAQIELLLVEKLSDDLFRTGR